MKHKLYVREFNAARAQARIPLELIGTHDFEGPPVQDGKGDVDGARAIALKEVAALYPDRKLHGLSCMVGGGFAAVIAPLPQG